MSELRPTDRVYAFGEYRLIAADRMLLRGVERVPVTPRVIHVLLLLVENAGRVVSKETLMSEVWSDTFVEEGNLNRTISRLRKTLGEKPNDSHFIETIPRVGYRFIADVAVSAVDGSPEKPRPPVARSISRMVWLAPLIVFVLALIAFSLLYFRQGSTTTATATKKQKNVPVRLVDSPTSDTRPFFSGDGKIRFARRQGDQLLSFVMDSNGNDQQRDTTISGLRSGSWSPDGKKVVYFKEGDESQSLYLASSDGFNEKKLPFLAGNMDWSPDSSKVVYQYGKPNSEIYLYTLATGKVTDLIKSPAFDADPSFSPDGESIAFVSDREGNPEIYTQKLDGSDLRRLTNHPAHDEFPTFSPDGTQIVFNSNREDENFDIYIIGLDGGNIRRLTNWNSDERIFPGCWSSDGTSIYLVSDHGDKDDIYVMSPEPYGPVEIVSDAANDLKFPVYSPDGKRLLYASEAEGKTTELHLLDLETKKNTTLLTTDSTETFPVFSPDGRWIVFQNRLGGNAEICIVSSDGGEARDLTNDPARDTNPAWSPDGSKIVFSSNRDGNYDVFQLYVMNSDGSNQHRIYYSNAISAYASWAPDGRRIVFANDKEDGRTGNFEIFSIEPETTTAETRLTFRRRYDYLPAYSPTGDRIAFASGTDGNLEIYLMNADGSGMIRLTRDVADDTTPRWSPDGKKIIFSSNRDGKFAINEITVDQ